MLSKLTLLRRLKLLTLTMSKRDANGTELTACRGRGMACTATSDKPNGAVNTAQSVRKGRHAQLKNYS